MTALSDWRTEVAQTLRAWQDAGVFTPACDNWLRGFDRDFSRRLAQQGWLGLTWPVEYGGAARSAVDRLVLTEELLRAGAPVAAHWMADRQIGPAVLRFGTDEQRRRHLPPVAAGESTWCLGMSEPDSGSDLASVRTTAVRDEHGWRLSGAKVWTSNAHRADHAYVLARTGSGADARESLSEFLLELSTPGVTVRPIIDLAGEHHFNELFLDDVRVPADALLGTEGAGWTQVTAQLAHERGGMERVLSTYPLLDSLLVEEVPDDTADRATLGRLLARMWALRRLALDVARQTDSGAAPGVAAAVLKDLGTHLESQVIDVVREITGLEPDPAGSTTARLLAQSVLAAPGFTIRGGTSEVLRSIVVRSAGGRRPRPELAAFADEVLTGSDPDPWATLAELGWPGVGVAEDLGGSGGTVADLLCLVEAVGRHGVSVPLVETSWAAEILAGFGVPLPPGAATVAVAGPGDARWSGDLLTVPLRRVPWGRAATTLVVVVRGADGEWIAVVPDTPTDWTHGVDLLDEPRDDGALDQAAVQVLGPVDPAAVTAGLRLRRAAELVGAIQTAVELSLEHTSVRTQFGRPLRAFQAVGTHLARLVGELEVVRAALSATASDPDPGRVAALWSVVAVAAGDVARAAHQVHGAVGTTREHRLQLSTRRLWSRRDEDGGPRRADLDVAADALGGADATWHWLTKE